MIANSLSHLFFLFGTVLVCGSLAAQEEKSAKPDYAAVDNTPYQYSVPVPDSKEMRAYLWIPPQCQKVRGLMIGIQNMMEENILADPEIRAALADLNMGVVWITPGDDFQTDAPYHRFTLTRDVPGHIAQTLQNLADESGYTEIANVPLIATAHSAATPFVWGLANAMPERMIAIFPCKGWFFGLPANVPALHLSSEYGEVGGVNWGETYLKDRVAVLGIRASGQGTDDRLISEAVDIGAGHYEWNPEAGHMVGMYLRKIVALRLPEEAPENGRVSLRRIDPHVGVLVDPALLGTPEAKAVPYGEWQGDPKKALWYPDAEMAQTINGYMTSRLAKKPQILDFIDGNRKPIDLSGGGVSSLPTDWLPDGFTFKVAATFLDRSPVPGLYGGKSVDHTPTQNILFRVSSGCLRQTGPDTFRVWMRRGGVFQQGNPWDPAIMAWQPSDADYRRADRPGQPHVVLMDMPDNKRPLNTAGTAQTIDFPKIGDVVEGTESLPLAARASSGLPVQYWVVSGPAVLADDNTTLKFLPIPPRSRQPVRVIVGAYQWGRRTDPKVQSTMPVLREFFIKKTADDPTGTPSLPVAFEAN